MFLNKSYIILFCILIATNINAQILNEYSHYFDAYSKIEKMLAGKSERDFKEAVFITENAYFDNELNREVFDFYIRDYVGLCRGIINSGNISYPERDTARAKAQCAVFVFMTDSFPVQIKNGVVYHKPFEYNFDDFAGQKDWSNMFVSTLMDTKKGNCHSLPYLYKIIMNELGQKCYLSLAPNHIYIKAINNRTKMYNIELTCGEFPTDAWLMASGYIHIDALRNGIYMDTLNLQQSIALCMVDLAQGYRAKFGVENGSFILQCCQTALKYFPNYINALLLKGETLTALYKNSEQTEEKERLLTQMHDLYANIHKLGYRKMPQEMYLHWLNSIGIMTDYRMKSLFINKDETE